jgi:flagellar P-ring protein FlgI
MLHFLLVRISSRFSWQCLVALGLIVASFCCGARESSAETRLRNICRVKGQEENVLRGLGLVVGLNGTGEPGDGPTMRAIARAMDLLGSPVGSNGLLDEQAIEELKKIKNASLVIVNASVPATGARRGEKIDCTVSALNGKSLVGGQLVFAALQGPNLHDKRVYALCSGSVHVESPLLPTVGRVPNGCQMEQDVFTPFYLRREDGLYVTLVVNTQHASFHVADDIVRAIENSYGDYFQSGNRRSQFDGVASSAKSMRPFVTAIDTTSIVVRVPKNYEQDPVAFVAELLDLRTTEEDPEARVDINLATNTITISGDVRIGDVVVIHEDIVVKAATIAVTELGEKEAKNPSLDRLVEQLSKLKVPERDMIEIIRSIDRLGKLHGKLVIQ